MSKDYSQVCKMDERDYNMCCDCIYCYFSYGCTYGMKNIIMEIIKEYEPTGQFYEDLKSNNMLAEEMILIDAKVENKGEVSLAKLLFKKSIWKKVKEQGFYTVRDIEMSKSMLR